MRIERMAEDLITALVFASGVSATRSAYQSFTILRRDRHAGCAAASVAARIAWYSASALRPASVTSVPPPRLPPRESSTSGSRKWAFIARTSASAFTYDIFIALAERLRLPVWSNDSSNCAFPGPNASSLPRVMRRRTLMETCEETATRRFIYAAGWRCHANSDETRLCNSIQMNRSCILTSRFSHQPPRVYFSHG